MCFGAFTWVMKVHRFSVFVGKLLTTHNGVYHDWSFPPYRCEWNLSCVCQRTGRTNAITITNDTGRLSKAGIDRMVAVKIASRDSLESYVYSVKQVAEDPNVDNKLNAADLETVKERLRRWWLCAKGIPCRIRKNTKKNKRIFNNCVLLSWPSSMDSSSSNSRILTALPMDSPWKKWTKPVKYYWQWFAFKTVDLYPKIFTKGKVLLIIVHHKKISRSLLPFYWLLSLHYKTGISHQTAEGKACIVIRYKMLLNVLANNTTAFLFYFEGSNPFLPFFSIFIYKCNAYNNYNVNEDVYFKVSHTCST